MHHTEKCKKIIGLMSGTSLDGLDIAYCTFRETNEHRLQFELIAAETIDYPMSWVKRLKNLEESSALEYALTDVELGHYFGRQVKSFMQRHPGHVDAIASHGHTVFHQPYRQLTTQIGDGDAIASECGLPVIFRFRNLDVALGGQGAPLVPIGDQLLFGQYDGCLNLGGIGNISYTDPNCNRIAFDICVCNMLLNHLSNIVGTPYDKDGTLASQGSINESIYKKMEELAYYQQPFPKTLGKEWFIEHILPIINSASCTVNDLMRTSVEHIANQISQVLKHSYIKTLLVTGGGTKNKFLIKRLNEMSPECKIDVTDENIIDYKEAIIFALLGYLRLEGRNNCLSSVTGAKRDCCGGVLTNPSQPK